MEKHDEPGRPGRFEGFVGALIRFSPFLGILWVGALGTFLALTFAGRQQFAWSFSTFLLLTAFLLVATLLRPHEASSFELVWTGLLRLLVHFNPKPQIEAKVEEALKALPAGANLEQIKPMIVESVAQATQGALKEVAAKLDTVLAEAKRSKTFPWDWQPSTLRLDLPASSIIDILSTPLGQVKLPRDILITDVSGKQALGKAEPEKKSPPSKP